MSTSTSNDETEAIFKGASLRMKMMIFKRNVFESRRRPKGILRPKNKPVLKDIAQVRSSSFSNISTAQGFKVL